MNGSTSTWRQVIFLMVTVGTPLSLCSQETNTLNTRAEELLYLDEDGGIPTELLEAYTGHVANPIDLNSASREELSRSGLFTPFQIEVLLRYRRQYGPLFSLNELSVLPGFRNFQLKELAPCLTLGKGRPTDENDPLNLMILLNGKRTYPTADGYIPGNSAHGMAAYAGPPLKTGFRFKADFSGTFSAGLGYEKDPGEGFIHRGKPEFLSGYILYKGTRSIQKLLLGCFRVHHGLGIVNGTGFMTSLETLPLHAPFSSKLVPYASFGESKYESGAGCQLSLGKIDLLLWSSFRTMDLSLQNIKEITVDIDWEESARTGGLHRTRNELAGRALAFRFHHGLVASVRLRNMAIGASLGWRSGGLTSRGRDSLRTDPGLSSHGAGSIHGACYNDRIELAWEVAVNNRKSIAFLAGIRVHLNDFLQGVFLVHRYGNRYRGMYPSSYAAGNQFRNEQGVAIGWHMEAGRAFVGDLTMELFSFPEPTYRSVVPSGYRRLGCVITNPGTRELNWKFRIYEKAWQSSQNNKAKGIPAVIHRRLFRAEMSFNYLPGRGRYGDPEDKYISSQGIRQAPRELKLRRVKLQWNSRVIFSWIGGQPANRPAFTVDQRINLRTSSFLSSTLQLVVFHVTSWENRIYLYEPGLLYSFNFPLCYGSGERITGVVVFKTGKKLTLSGKLSTVIYHDREVMGSGPERREGNQKWEWELQMRMKL